MKNGAAFSTSHSLLPGDVRVGLSGENAPALGIGGRAVIFTGMGRLSIWGNYSFFAGPKKTIGGSDDDGMIP